MIDPSLFTVLQSHNQTLDKSQLQLVNIHTHIRVLLSALSVIKYHGLEYDRVDKPTLVICARYRQDC